MEPTSENLHDNSRPANAGSISISQSGLMFYYPIEIANGAKPFQALILHLRANGDIIAMLDYRFPPSAVLGPLED